VSRILPDGTWSEPYNLGKSINTRYDEITPHIDKTDAILYFSSKGHPGNGGFDIFYSKLANKGRWGEPVNMVEPINSKSDDIAYITTTDPNSSYFSSSRRGGSGNFDIYKTGNTKEIVPNEEKPLITNLDKIPEKDSIDKKEALSKVAETEKPVKENIKPAVTSTSNPIVEAPKTIETPTKNDVVRTTEAPKPSETPKTSETPKNTEPPKTVETPKTNIVQQNTKVVPVKPNYNLPLNKDTAILNSSMKGLVFRVQLGAFRNQITTNSSYFDKLNKSAIREELSAEMLYKYTIGNFDNISRATKAKQVLRDSGFNDAFLACYFNSQRVTMDEVLMMLDKKVYERVAIYQK
jgi:hypothetical protein